MNRKLSALVAILVATVLAGWGAGAAVAAPAKARIGGGSGILVLKGGNTASACTMTTVGRSKTGKLIGITAGHCGEPGQRVFSETYQNRGQIGTVTYSASDLDMAIIALDPAKVTPVRTVRGVTIRRIDTRPAQFPTIACKEGRTSGNTCGLVWFSEDGAHYSQMCVIEGDSGSPVVVGDRLIGMVNAYYFSACIGPETGTNISPILARVRSIPAYGGFTPI